MASLITLKRRISSVRGTRQITKAMQLVSASKLRRAQEQAHMSRAYREAAYGLLARLASYQEVVERPLFRKRPVKTRWYVVITSNSGMAGAYNANVLKLLAQSVMRDRTDGVKSMVTTIGNKGAQFVRRLPGVELQAHYPAFGDEPSERVIQPILRSLVDKYIEELVDEVIVIYTAHKSGIVQEATSLPLLPARLDQTSEAMQPSVAPTFEPNLSTVIRVAAVRLIEVQVWQVLLESLASEHAMRMLAMKSATDNATELIEDYTLEYNTARQAAITQEIAEITGGAEALNV